MSKINVLGIVAGHVRTLKDDTTGRYDPIDFLLFFVSPAAVAATLLLTYGRLDGALVATIATSLSVFAALLFNLLLLVYEATRRNERRKDKSPKSGEFLMQLSDNTSFAILVAVTSLVTVVTLVFVSQVPPAALVFSGAIYFLVTLFTLTLLMILKRIHVLLKM